MIEQMKLWLYNFNIGEHNSTAISWAISIGIVVLLACIVNFIVKKLILRWLAIIITKSRSRWDDAFLHRKVLVRLSHLAPALVIYAFAPAFPKITAWVQRFSIAYITIVGLSAAYAFLNAAEDVYYTFDISKHRPIKGFIQIAKIVLAVLTGVVIISIILNQSPTLILGGLGALTAIIVLVFKDTILGLVASIQLTTNDMLRIGDSIEMPKYAADGEVTDMSLHTVKVRNWDQTITTIPTYALMTDSFKNWRGMSESGGRRIKRALNIDMNSVKFCDAEMLTRFKKFQLISDYVAERKAEIDNYNKENNIDTSELVNGRNMTNLGTFRAYVNAYLKSHPQIRNDMNLLVRYLPPGPHGLPIEIYVFSREKAWADYESFQADIFDHLLAVIPRFDLRVFQNPSGADVRVLREH